MADCQVRSAQQMAVHANLPVQSHAIFAASGSALLQGCKSHIVSQSHVQHYRHRHIKLHRIAYVLSFESTELHHGDGCTHFNLKGNVRCNSCLACAVLCCAVLCCAVLCRDGLGWAGLGWAGLGWADLDFPGHACSVKQQSIVVLLFSHDGSCLELEIYVCFPRS